MIFARLFDRWAKSRSFTSNELLVLKHLLAGNPESSHRLFSQAVNTPYVERKLTSSRQYEANIPYVLDPSTLIECNQCVVSPPLFVTTETGERLMFSTTILPGGFLQGLKGEVVGGNHWPKQWTANAESAAFADPIDAWIPSPIDRKLLEQQLLRLCVWCGLSREVQRRLGETDRVRTRLAATQSDLRAFESRHRVRLGNQYLELTAITNGFEVLCQRWDAILAVQDLFFIDDNCHWLCFTNSSEDGCTCFRRAGKVITDECFHTSVDGQSLPSGDLRDYCRQLLTSCIE